MQLLGEGWEELVWNIVCWACEKTWNPDCFFQVEIEFLIYIWLNYRLGLKVNFLCKTMSLFFWTSGSLFLWELPHFSASTAHFPSDRCFFPGGSGQVRSSPGQPFILTCYMMLWGLKCLWLCEIHQISTPDKNRGAICGWFFWTVSTFLASSSQRCKPQTHPTSCASLFVLLIVSLCVFWCLLFLTLAGLLDYCKMTTVIKCIGRIASSEGNRTTSLTKVTDG